MKQNNFCEQIVKLVVFGSLIFYLNDRDTLYAADQLDQEEPEKILTKNRAFGCIESLKLELETNQNNISVLKSDLQGVYDKRKITPDDHVAEDEIISAMYRLNHRNSLIENEINFYQQSCEYFNKLPDLTLLLNEAKGSQEMTAISSKILMKATEESKRLSELVLEKRLCELVLDILR